MKINPVYRQETRISARSYRLPLIILLCNSVLALVALLDMYSMINRVKTTAEIQYSSFLSLYVFVASIEFIMLLLIVPALTSGSISGERERQTLNLLLTTRMTPADIVVGKLLASLSTVFLLIVSSFPILALVFIYGGVTAADMGVVLLCFSSTALLAGCVGICCSSVFKRSAIATASSYCVMAVLVFGTMALFQFAASLRGGAAETPDGTIWLLLLNPAVSFAAAIKNQMGSLPRIPLLDTWAGNSAQGMTAGQWLGLGIGAQLAASGLCLWIAVCQVNPQEEKEMDQLSVIVETGKLAVGVLLLLGGAYTWYRVRKQVRLVSKAIFGTPSLKEGLERQADILAETPKSVSGMTRLCLPQIESDFPEFHWAQWKQRCENLLKSYLAALERQDLSLLLEASEELKRQTAHEIDDQNRRGVRECYRQVKVHQTEISRYQKEAGLCVIKLQSAVEYYYEEKVAAGREASGRENGRKRKKKEAEPQGSVRQQHRYNMELVYIQDISKVGDYATVLGATCPNCGAPITRLGSKFCEYCGTGVIPIDIRVWKLHRIERE